MASVLNAASWQTVRFIDIFHVQSGAPGTKSNYFGHTDLYQLAFKIRGETAIVYGGKPLAFCTRKRDLFTERDASGRGIP